MKKAYEKWPFAPVVAPHLRCDPRKTQTTAAVAQIAGAALTRHRVQVCSVCSAPIDNQLLPGRLDSVQSTVYALMHHICVVLSDLLSFFMTHQLFSRQ